jgi:uncharacterized RDD family membrane protein YckC
MIEYQRSQFAGFWIRFAALVIDVIVVSIIVFPFAFLIGLVAPNSLLVEVPFDLFTTTTTLSEDDEAKVSIEKDDVLGIWTNYYQVTESLDDNGDTSTSRILIDPVTELGIEKTTSDDIETFVIFVYWILLEASAWQASLGKRIFGIKVVTQDGGKPDIFQCTARNLLKILSALILCIGFMMAGWTDRKQALHDKITRLLVVKQSALQSDQQKPAETDATA